jgi:hypothetical protein
MWTRSEDGVTWEMEEDRWGKRKRCKETPAAAVRRQTASSGDGGVKGATVEDLFGWRR